MHEVLFTKGDTQGLADDKRLLINDPRNCVLIDQQCHAIAQHNPAAHLRLIKHLIIHEGYSNVREFIELMKQYVPNPDYRRALHEINQAKLELETSK